MQGRQKRLPARRESARGGQCMRQGWGQPAGVRSSPRGPQGSAPTLQEGAEALWSVQDTVLLKNPSSQLFCVWFSIRLGFFLGLIFLRDPVSTNLRGQLD